MSARKGSRRARLATAAEDRARNIARRRAMEGLTIGQTYLGTDVHADPPARTLQQRSGRCFELSALAVAMGPVQDAVLVHGSIHGPWDGNERIAHAWVALPGNRIWEPMTAAVWEYATWVAYAEARIERTYDRNETSLMMLTTGNYGCWHETQYPTNPPVAEGA